MTSLFLSAEYVFLHALGIQCGLLTFVVCDVLRVECTAVVAASGSPMVASC